MQKEEEGWTEAMITGWKAVGALGLILAIVATMLGLIHFGQKYEKQKQRIEDQQAEIWQLRGQLSVANEWKTKAVAFFDGRFTSLTEWQVAADSQRAVFRAALARQPSVEYRTIIDRVPIEVPIGDCQQAAVASWQLLHEAGVAGVPP